MKITFRSLLLASTVFMSASMATHAMAAHGAYEQRHAPHQTQHKNQHQDQFQNQHHSPKSRPSLNTHRPNAPDAWRSGEAFPQRYSHAHYQVQPSELSHLPKSHAREQWYKVDGRYVLVNTKNHKVLRVIH